MSTLIKILAVTALIIVGVAIGPKRIKEIQLEYTPPTYNTELIPLEYIQMYSEQYGSNAEELQKVIKCESNFKQSAIGDGGHAIGISQFHRPTWESFTKKMGEELDINSYADQIKVTAWAFSHKLKGHWTCSKIVGIK